MAARSKKPAPTDAKQLGDPEARGFLLQNSPFYLLAQVNGRYTLDMERSLKRVGMDLPRWRVLMVVNEHNPSSISEIAHRAVMRLSTMTKVAQRLEQEGLVRLEPCATDGRKTDVFITADGLAAVEKIRRVASRIYRQAFADFEPQEVEHMLRMLRRLLVNLEQQPDA